MQSINTNDADDARTQRRERRDAVRTARERELAQQTTRRERQRLAAQSLGMLQTREQSVGRILPFTGRTVRPLTGRFHPRAWTVLFRQVLLSMLSTSLTPAQLRQVNIHIDNTHDRDEIDIWDKKEYKQVQQPRGATKGNLNILVRGGDPCTGLSRYSISEADWRATTCSTERMARVEMSPFREITHRIDRLGETLRLRDFPCWEHGIWLDQQGGAGIYKLYHTDYNITYQVMKIVSEVIKEHYLRMGMQGPDAPWDL